VLTVGGEYYILDFEGEPIRSLAERRQKDQALRDVAGMLRSLEYAGLMAWKAFAEQHGETEDNDLEIWIQALIRWSEKVFLDAYYATSGEATFLPDPASRDLVLWVYELEKVLYEVRYELGHRPNWVFLPLEGLSRLLNKADQEA
jgi:maltose alpha-D-glucosyltransferase / alpha-amylase